MGFLKSLGNAIGSAAGGNLLGAGASLFGSLLGSSSNSSTNKTNMAIARENNALQERMFYDQLAFNERMTDKNNAFNESMWQKNNEYNTPAAQMQRYLAAGLNPYMMFGQTGSSGISSAAVSGTAASGAQPPQLNTPTMQSYDPSNSFTAAGQHIAAAARNNAEVDNIREDTQSKNIDNQTRNLKNLEEINKLIADTKNSHTRAALERQQWELTQATWNDTIKQVHLQNKSLEEQTKLTEQTRLGVELDNKLKDINIKYAPATFSAQVAKIWSDIRLNSSSVSLNRSHISLNKKSEEKLAQDVLESIARQNGFELNNSQVEQLTPLLVEGAGLDNLIKGHESYRLGQENLRNFDPADTHFLPSGARWIWRNFSPLNGLFKK